MTGGARVRPAVRSLAPLVVSRPLAALPAPAGFSRAIRLSANENALGPSPHALEAAASACADGRLYPDASGTALKARIAVEFGADPAGLVLGAGSNELIDLLVRLVVEPGDEVVTATATFPLYAVCTRLSGGAPVAVPDRGLAHDLDAMLGAIGPRTKLVFVCNPNNPTGALVDPDAWRRFLERVPPGVLVVSDEAYREYAAGEDFPDTLADVARGAPLVVLRTFSKIHALAGLRVGYAVAAPETAALLDRVRMPFNVSAPAQAAAVAALDDRAHVERSRTVARAGKAFLAEQLPALGVAVHATHTNFVLADLGRDARPVCAALEARGFVLRDLVTFGMAPNFVRITAGTEEENAAFVAALAVALAGGAA